MTKVIKKILIDKDLTIADLARKIGKSRIWTSYVVNGHIKSPEVREAKSRELGTRVEDLWDNHGAPRVSQGPAIDLWNSPVSSRQGLHNLIKQKKRKTNIAGIESPRTGTREAQYHNMIREQVRKQKNSETNKTINKYINSK